MIRDALTATNNRLLIVSICLITACAPFAGCMTSPAPPMFIADASNTGDESGLKARLDMNRLAPPRLQTATWQLDSNGPSFEQNFRPSVTQSDGKLQVQVMWHSSTEHRLWLSAVPMDSEVNAIILAKAAYRLTHPLSDREKSQALATFAVSAKSCPSNGTIAFLLPIVQQNKVQADDAVLRHDYWAAIDHYQEAVNAAPCWSDGYYNSALLLADQNDYSDAIDQMNRYLLLVPNSPDSGKAQQQIWIWQGREQASSTHSGP